MSLLEVFVFGFLFLCFCGFVEVFENFFWRFGVLSGGRSFVAEDFFVFCFCVL